MQRHGIPEKGMTPSDRVRDDREHYADPPVTCEFWLHCPTVPEKEAITCVRHRCEATLGGHVRARIKTTV